MLISPWRADSKDCPKAAGKPAEAITYYTATPSLAAIKCFGTDDPSGKDEIYVVISLININPNFKGEDELVKTILIGPQPVAEGQVFGEMITLGEVRPVGAGVKVHVAVFDREQGKPEQVRKAIEEKLKELAQIALVSLSYSLTASGSAYYPDSAYSVIMET